ncbi:hypothetical protein MBLNU457_6296t1 [Dothideomycetes sp. NU457]
MRGHNGWSAIRPHIRGSLRSTLTAQFIQPQRQSHIWHQLRHSQKRPSLVRTQQRYASQSAEDAASGATRVKNLVLGTTIVVALSFTYLYVTDTRAGIHEWLVVPALRWFVPDAEDAHQAGNRSLKALYTFGLHPRERGNPDANGDLRVEVFGHVLDNPIGTSAGLDKNAEIPDPVLALGPGLVEVGGITPLPQEGNPKPRVWRIPSQNAIINRYGLNSEGADSVALRLRQRLRKFAYDIGLGLDPEAERKVLDGEAGVPPGSLTPGRLLAVQVAKQKDTPDQDIQAVARDYVYCVDQVAKYADILVVNVSSPNTPGLRSLQQSAPLTAILTSVVGAAQAADRKKKPAVMVKVSPDEDSEEQVRGICDAVWASGVDGIIVGNTTKKRPDPLPRGYLLQSKEEQIMLEQGGYSGPQLFERTVALVKKYRRTLDQGPIQLTPEEQKGGSKPSEQPDVQVSHDGNVDITPERIEASVERDAQRLKPMTPEAEADSKMPIIKIPERHAGSAEPAHELQAAEPALSSSTHAVQGNSASSSPAAPTTKSTPAPDSKEKVIFATGGITNGKQALEVLNAGASIAMVYTAVVYGGAGTISRIKTEMRNEMKKR